MSCPQSHHVRTSFDVPIPSHPSINIIRGKLAWCIIFLSCHPNQSSWKDLLCSKKSRFHRWNSISRYCQGIGIKTNCWCEDKKCLSYLGIRTTMMDFKKENRRDRRNLILHMELHLMNAYDVCWVILACVNRLLHHYIDFWHNVEKYLNCCLCQELSSPWGHSRELKTFSC